LFLNNVGGVSKNSFHVTVAIEFMLDDSVLKAPVYITAIRAPVSPFNEIPLTTK
jgi:hypothetical protein